MIPPSEPQPLLSDADVVVRADDHRLVVANNLDFLATLDDASVKLVVTSPPYNLGKEYEDRTSMEAYVDAQAKVIAEAVRVLHPAGSIRVARPEPLARMMFESDETP